MNSFIKLSLLMLIMSCLISVRAQHVFHALDGKIVMKGNSQLVLKNTSYVNGVSTILSDSATVRFTGSHTDSIGGAATAFPRIAVAKTTGNVVLKKDISIADSIILNSGLIVLEDEHVTLMPGAGSGAGSATSYVQTTGSGTFKRNVENQAVVFPVGGSSYRPVTLSNSGTPDVVDVRVTDSVLMQGTSGSAINSEVVGATWHVGEQNSGGSIFDMTLGWNGTDERTSFDRTRAYISAYNQSWDIQPSVPANGSGPYFLSRTNLSGGGLFAIFNEDTTPPEITCPSNIVQANDQGVCGAVVAYIVPQGTDNLLEPVTVLTGGLGSGGTFPLGTTTEKYIVTDAAGNIDSCSFNITIYDDEDPIITCPANITISNDTGVCGAIVIYTVSSTDNCTGGALSQTSGQASGTVFPIGTTTNAFTVTDASSNTDSCSFTVTVNDTENPTIVCPANITVSNDSSVCSALVNYAVNHADNCSGDSLTQTAGLPSGSTFPIGSTSNAFTVIDASGNTASCSFIVTVNDTENPNIVCPANITVSNDSSVCGALVNYAITHADNCSVDSLIQTAGLPSRSTFPIGNTSNAFTVTDASGNTANCSFTVTVNDTENPAIDCPANITISNDSSVCGALVNYTVTHADNCTGDSLIQTAGIPSGSTFLTGSTNNAFTVTDASGNTASCSFTVTVNDAENPIITCPADITVSNDSSVCGALVNYTVTHADNCPGDSLVQTAGQVSGSTFPIGTTSNSFTVTDASGNTASCSFTVTVNDTENPTIVCPANITVSNDSNVCGAVVTYTVSAADNCSGDSLVQTAGQVSGSTFPIGSTSNSFTVTDASGNMASCSFTVTVNDTENPVITCPAAIHVSNDTALCGAIVSYSISSSDNCSSRFVQTDTSGLTSGGFFPVGSTMQSYLATDSSGNTAVCSFLVTVIDTAAPQIVCPANIVVNNDSGACGAIVSYAISSSDNCSATHAQVDSSGLISGSFFPVGTTKQSYLATDASGNTTGCSFTITVTDTAMPIINIGPAVVNHCQFDPWIDPGYSASDICGGDLTTQVVISGAVNVQVPGTYYLYYDVQDVSGNAATRQTRQVIIDPSPQISALPASVCPGSTINIASLVRDYTMLATMFRFYANGTLVGQSPTRLGQARYPSIQTINSDTVFTVIAIAPNGCPDTAQIIISVRSCGSTLAAKVMLEGAYDSTAGNMRDNLRSQNLIPMIEPYTAMGYQFIGGGGEIMQSGVTATTGSDAIVDWVVVELRESASPGTITYSRAALLQADGDVVETDGTSTLSMDSIAPGNYYIVLSHRNHLAVMTAQPEAFGSSNISIDFSDPTQQVYGVTVSRKTVNGTCLLFGGDADHNGQVQNTDNVMEWIPTTGTAGYKPADFDLNGQVQNTDRVYLWMQNVGKGSAVPR